MGIEIKERKTFLRIKGGVVVGDAISIKPMPEVAGDDEWRECDGEALQRFRSGMVVKPADDGVGFVFMPLPAEVRASMARTMRNALLEQTDRYDTASSEARLGSELFQKWMDYRQALRDLPTAQGFPEAFKWPAPPGAVVAEEA